MRLKIAYVWIGIVAASVLASVSIVAQQTPVIARFTATTSNVSGAGDTIRIDILKWSTDAERDQFLNAWTHPAPPPAPAVAAAPAAAPDAAAAPRGGGARGGGARGAAVGGRGAPPAAGGAVAPPLPPVAAAGDGAAPPADAAVPPRGGGRGGGARGAAGGAPGGRGAAPAAAAEAPVDTPESTLLAALQKTNTVGILWTSDSAVGYSLKYAYRVTQPGGGERIIFATDRRLGMWSDQWWKPTSGGVPTNLSFTVFEIRIPATGDGEGRTTLTGKIAEDSAAKSIAVDSYPTQPVVFKAVKKAK